MFTKNDLISYLSDLEMIETNMRDTYDQAIKNVKDERVSRTFSLIRVEEDRHKIMVGELRALIIGESITEEL